MKLVKWIVRGIGLLAFLLILAGIVSFIFRPGEAPSVEKAPWGIQTYSVDGLKTPSRYFLAESVEIIDGTPIMSNYWKFDGKYYQHIKDSKALPESEYGKIDIVRRK